MTRNGIGRLLATSALATALIGTSAAAQTTGTTGGAAGAGVGADEIVVTAQRRSESIQDIPLAISVVDGDALLAQAKTSSDDILRDIPGVDIRRSPQGASVNIRGIASQQGGGEVDPGISYSVDGVYNPFTEVSLLSFTDLDRVEVLKGPQGTLYGRNAIAGAVNVITKSPVLGQFTGYTQVSVGNYNAIGTTGVVNVPLGETVALRVVGDYQDNSGYLNNGSDDTNVVSGRAKLLFEPSSTLRFELRGDYAKFGGRGNAPVRFPLQADPWTAFPTPVEPSQDIEYWGVSGEANLDLGFATLTYIPAYKRKTNETATDGGGTFIRSYVNDRQHTQELRLASNDTTPLSWIIGGYYYRGRNVGGLSFGPVTIAQNVLTTSYAAFGQATFALTDAFRVTGGLRYTQDNKKENGTNSVNGNLVSSISGIEFTWKKWTWKAGVEFDVAPRSMLYANVSTGFKAGGTSLVAGPAAFFDPEELTAYEVGWKNRLFDNQLTLNVSGFYYDYSNYQAIFVAPNPQFGNANVRRIANAGAAKIKGFEVESVYTPTPEDRLTATFAYLHGRFGDYIVPTPVAGVVNDYSNSKISAPPWTATVSYAHDFTLGSGRLTPMLSARMAGGSYRDARQFALVAPGRPAGTYVVPQSYQDYFVKLDFNVSYAWAEDRFRVSAWVRNITNEAVRPTSTATSAYLEPPRVYGLALYASW